MKNFLFLAIAFFTIQTISAQDVAKTQNENVFNTSTVDIKPEFPGGYDEFYKFIAKNYKTPNVARLKGKIYVTFIVEKDGSIDEIQVLRDIGYGTGQEAIRVLKLSPKWMPGEQNGQKVRCNFSLPISIESSR
jgi:Gram-negative bacterial TonB protein C-terminal